MAAVVAARCIIPGERLAAVMAVSGSMVPGERLAAVIAARCIIPGERLAAVMAMSGCMVVGQEPRSWPVCEHNFTWVN